MTSGETVLITGAGPVCFRAIGYSNQLTVLTSLDRHTPDQSHKVSELEREMPPFKSFFQEPAFPRI
jgi:hypothetical protein